MNKLITKEAVFTEFALALAALVLGTLWGLFFDQNTMQSLINAGPLLALVAILSSAFFRMIPTRGVWLALAILVGLPTLGFGDFWQGHLPIGWTLFQAALLIHASLCFLSFRMEDPASTQRLAKSVVLVVLTLGLALQLLTIGWSRPNWFTAALFGMVLILGLVFSLQSRRVQDRLQLNWEALWGDWNLLAKKSWGGLGLGLGLGLLMALPFSFEPLSGSVRWQAALYLLLAGIGAASVLPKADKAPGTAFFPATLAVFWLGLIMVFELSGWERTLSWMILAFYAGRLGNALLLRFRTLMQEWGIGFLFAGLLIGGSFVGYYRPSQSAGIVLLAIASLLTLTFSDWWLVHAHRSPQPFVARFKMAISRLVARIFFQKIFLIGREKIPSSGPFLLVANHPNTFFDPLLLTAFVPGPIAYLAKSTLWKVPVLGSILTQLGAIPVFRAQDSGTDVRDNQKTFKKALDALKAGQRILIFPEGVSEQGLCLKPLKTGAVRLAVQALQAGISVPVLPIALDYAEPGIFRSTVTLRILDPIPLEDRLHELEASKTAVREETQRLFDLLSVHLPSLSDPEMETLVHQIEALYGEHLQQVLASQDPGEARLKIAQAINHYQKIDPQTVQHFAEKMNSYWRQQAALETPENHAPLSIKTLVSEWRNLGLMQHWGLIFHWLPYQLTRLFVQHFEPSGVWMATFKLCVGTVVFSLYYTLFLAAGWMILGPFLAMLLLGQGIASGIPAMSALDHLEDRTRLIRTVWQAFWTQNTDAELADQRQSLLEDLERFREGYSFFLAEGDAE